MPDEVTNAELARRLDGMARELHEDIGEIRRRLDAYVLREVHDAQQRGMQQQVDALRADLSGLRGYLRWLIGGPVVAVVALIAQVVLSLRGPV